MDEQMWKGEEEDSEMGSEWGEEDEGESGDDSGEGEVR